MSALIVGGGLGGLAAALALARRGIASHVLEQSPSFGEIGAGIQLGPNVFRMFDRLGVAEAISRDAVFVDRLVMMDALTEEAVVTGDLGAAFRKRFGAPYAVTHRADFHRTLLEACEASGRSHSRPMPRSSRWRIRAGASAPVWRTEAAGRVRS